MEMIVRKRRSRIEFENEDRESRGKLDLALIGAFRDNTFSNCKIVFAKPRVFLTRMVYRTRIDGEIVDRAVCPRDIFLPLSFSLWMVRSVESSVCILIQWRITFSSITPARYYVLAVMEGNLSRDQFLTRVYVSRCLRAIFARGYY